MKRKNSKKGFTLIELIVVIAILGILALIAVPRLAGFTNKAKEANDKELASIVAHSIATLIASGDLTVTTASTVTVENSAATGPLGYTFGGGDLATKVSGANEDNMINNLVGTDKFMKRATQFVVNVTADGDVPVANITFTWPS